MADLFSEGVVIIPPDKETNLNPYVDGVIMSQIDGSVTGAVPNTVVDTSDGCVFSDGTMCVNRHLTPFGLYFYDTNFNQTQTNLVFPGFGTSDSPPSPVSDFSQWAYVCKGPGLAGDRQTIKRMNKSGSVDSTVWTLARVTTAFAVDPTNTWFYYFDGLGNIATHVLGTDSTGPVLYTGTDPKIGTGTSIRVIPATGNVLALFNNFNLNAGLGFIQVWCLTGLNSETPGTVLWQATTSGVPGNTDATMQIDVGTPNEAFWVRTYDGAFDRQDGCTFSQFFVSNGALITTWHQTIVQVDGGVSDGVLPATCPLFTWSNPSLLPPNGGGAANLIGTRQTRPMRRLRRSAQMVDELFWLFVSEFQLMFQPGVGNANDPGKNPVFTLRWSDDGGLNWSNPHNVPAGQMGQTGTRAIWRMLGRARNRVWEVTVSDPVFWPIIDAFVKVEKQAGA